MKLRRNIVITAVSLAFMGAGFTGVAVASGGEQESPGDQARQDAACEALPSTATNIDYDDETGICKLDSGDDEGDDEGGEDGGDE